MVVLDIISELNAWLATEQVQKTLAEIVGNAVDERFDELLREELVDAKEAAKILSISPAALRKRVERGQVNPVRIGTSLRFRRSDLLQR